MHLYAGSKKSSYFSPIILPKTKNILGDVFENKIKDFSIDMVQA
jgi:hypothetical protein